MKILKLAVYNHNRITLGERLIEYTPNKRIAVLLGDNGSGKSTFLGLLFPRVVNLNELEKDGYVRLLLEEDGKTIEIATDEHTRAYHFLVDGVEMNPKSSIRLQEELISTYIRINKDIHNLLTGVIQFTKASVKQRRDILEYLSGNDYTYINELYMFINRKYMDKKAIVAHTDKRLLEAQKSLAELEEENKTHERDIKEAKAILEGLLDASNSSARAVDIDALERRLELSDKVLSDYVKYRKSLIRQIRRFPIGTYAKLDTWKRSLDRKYSILDGKIGALADTHMQLSESQGDDEEHFSKVDRLRTRIEEANTALEAIPKDALDRLSDVEDVDTLFTTLNVYKFKLREIADIPLEYFKVPSVDEAVLEAQRSRLIAVSKTRDDLRQEKLLLDSISMEEDIHCPKCDFGFKQGYDEDKHLKIKRQLGNLDAEVELLKTQISELETQKEHSTLASNAEDIFRGFIQSLPDSIAKYFGNSVNANLITNLQSIISACQYRISYDELKKSLETHKGYLEQLESIDIKAMVRRQQKVKALEDDISRLSKDRQTIRNTLERVNSLVATRELAMKSGQDLHLAKQDVEDIISLRKDYLLQSYLDKQIVKARDRYYRLENIDIRRSRLMKDIETISNDLTAMNLELSAYRNVVAIIHPKGKHIARSIVDFLNIFIGAINDNISRVWSYPVELCRLERGNAISYKLPFMANGIKRGDISLASTATADMIDIAIKLAVMDSLGMNDYPLYLDELGSGYDAEHSRSLCALVNDLSADDRFSNLFVVSNDAEVSNYLRHLDIDTVMLADNNIVL